MTYVLAVIAGIVGAVVGWFVTAGVAAAVAGFFGMSDFEGGRGMFAGFVVGPIGGLVTMVVSIWLVLRTGLGRAPLGWSLVRIGIVVAAIAIMVTTGILIRLLTLDTYTNTSPPQLEFEIRVPAAMAVPDRSALRVELHTDKNVGEGQLHNDWSPTDDERKVIDGSVDLDFKTSSRLLVVFLPEQPTRLFRLSLSRDPESTATLGAWKRADHVHVQGEEQPRKALADDPVEIRYRVRRAGED